MATYINGVTDYLPQIQPFKPDLNFYNSVLQTKENQYEQGYQKISRLYGTLLNSPMLRESDIKRRSDFFNQVNQEIQKLSMVDLSLEQNVSAARQVFQPLLNDKNIVSDMSYTKMYNNEVQRAENLRNSVQTDKNKRNSYWEEGRQNLEYWRQDYQRTTDEEALKYNWTPRYVPNVDINGQFQSLMKDSKFKITSTGLSRDGRFIVEQTNGNLMTTPLTQYLVGTLGSDPGVADMYRVMAENQRHRWVDQNAQNFGGDHGVAEDAYYRMMVSGVKDDLTTQKQSLNNSNSVLDAKISVVKDRINKMNNGVSPNSEIMEALSLLLREREVASQATTQVDDALSNIESVGMFTEDRMARRQTLDKGYGHALMTQNMYGLADTYSQLTSETKFKTNPYKLAQEKYAMQVALADRKFQQGLYKDELAYKRDLAKIKYKQDLKKGATDATGPTGSNDYVPNTGSETRKGASTPQLDELQAQFTQQHKIKKQQISHQEAAVKQFYSDLANIADYETDETKRTYARSLLDQTFGKPAQGKLYSDVELKSPEKYYNNVTGLITDKTFKSAFNNISSKVDDDIKMANIENQAILSYHDVTRKNIENLYSYLNANKGNIKNTTDYDLEIMRAVIDPNLGNTRSAQEIYNTLKKKYPEMTMEDAEEARTKYQGIFRDHYSAGYTVGTNKDPIVRPYDWIPGQELNTGGRAANPITSRVGSNPDDLNLASMDAKEMHRFMKNNADSKTYNFYKGRGVSADEKDDAISPDERSDVYNFLDYALNTLTADMGNKRAKGKLSEGTELTVHPIIMNDKNMRGVTFSIPEAVFNKWKKDSKNTGASYDDYANITMVMPAGAAPTSIFNRFEPKPVKAILMSGKSLDITYPNAGTIRLVGNSNGTVSTAGTVKWVGEDGKINEGPANTIGMNPNADPDYMYWTFMARMKELDQKNYDLLNSPYNPNNAGDIKSADEAEQFIRSGMQTQ